MITKEDVRQIEQRGSSVQTVEEQVERFKKGFPWMNIVAPATPQKGILVIDELFDITDEKHLTRIQNMDKPVRFHKFW